MKILFDENMPRPLRQHFIGHSVYTVQDMGWAGVTNGSLLALADAQNFNILLTFDRNLEYQQNLTGRKVAVIVIVASDKRVSALLPLVPDMLNAVANAQPGSIVQIKPPATPPNQP